MITRVGCLKAQEGRIGKTDTHTDTQTHTQTQRTTTVTLLAHARRGLNIYEALSYMNITMEATLVGIAINYH